MLRSYLKSRALDGWVQDYISITRVLNLFDVELSFINKKRKGRQWLRKRKAQYIFRKLIKIVKLKSKNIVGDP